VNCKRRWHSVKTVAVSSSLKERPALEESSGKSSEKILSLVRIETALSAREIALRLGITPRVVEKQIARLQKDGRLKRAGPAKGGHWHVIES
jgi:predicted HTH transcriptional regulator